jgi:putative FmdB family regulatory protein
MPIYEYKCAKCGKTIEVIQKMSDKPLKKHEQCGGTLTKLISAAGFQFKGTGWYVTDYARKSSGESKETSTDTKTESKETSSNGSKEGNGSGSAGAAKAEGGKGKAGQSSSAKSGSKKD